LPDVEPAARLDADLLARWRLPVDEDGDKHARGTVLVIGGAPTTVGAVLLAGVSALRMGAGRLQIGVAAGAGVQLGIAVPEAMVVELPHHDDGRLRPHRASRSVDDLVRAADAILIGPGLRNGPAALAFVADVVAASSPECVLVLDAAALGAAQSTDLSDRRGRVVLTPNRQEAEHLVDAHGRQDDLGHDALVRRVAHERCAVVSSFGTVASYDGRWWNAGQGGPGLGTSGSGDVLGGLVVGAAARCGDAAQAACWATYVHTVIGQRLAARCGRLGFIARDLVEEIPQVMMSLEPSDVQIPE
jgi:ADP-dependent NAD(P)H-hydrate dehydratase